MKTSLGHVGYCTNIHAGERWNDHFQELKKNIPVIKQKVAPNTSLGIGLRLSNKASEEILEGENLKDFLLWLDQEDCYIFTMNGFPYGGFHHQIVKDQVHAPDWTTDERVSYTLRLFDILVKITTLKTAGISTSPLTYRHWHPNDNHSVFDVATKNILRVVAHLYQLKKRTGQSLHLDIEPEPDGLLESGEEFIAWYNNYLLPIGKDFLSKLLVVTEDIAESIIREHVQLCYDVCHFAVGFEDHQNMIQTLRAQKIKTGKIQVSAALKGNLMDNRSNTINAFKTFNETTYLHQVIAKQKGNALVRYKDLPDALAAQTEDDTEWRAHFHVPIFIEEYGNLTSTQADIKEVIRLQEQFPFTQQLEIETYTWEVLPTDMRLPLADSITREINWLLQQLH